jgi:hypothetical protein
MISKKFKNFVIAIFFLALNNVAVGAEASSGAHNQLPILYYAGVIPVQWEKNASWRELHDARKLIDSEFSPAVRASNRFVFLNDDVTRSLWSSDSGRKELENDYELSAFVSLDVASRGDMIVLTTRLLSPKLQTRLQESDIIPRNALLNAKKEQITGRLTDLVLRMINRLPVDAHITSLNGGYVTLSGGTDQGVKVGDKYDVLDATVSSMHPVNGGWLKFNTMRTGSIEIIEVKSRSAIAKIASLAKDNGVKAGQGVRIQDISGRSRFAAADAKATKPSEVTKTDPAVAPSAPVETKPAQSTQPEDNANLAKAAKVPPTPPTTSDSASQAAQTPGSEDRTPSVVKLKENGPSTDNFTARIMPKGSEMRTWAGMRMWSVSGSASAKATLPVWLVNAAAADIYREFSDTIDFNYGVDFGYGPTGDGSFFSYNLHSAGRWHMFMKDLLPGADDVYFGLVASFSSASITGETSGGWDMTMMRFTMGVHGWAKPEFIGEKIEWTGEVFYPLYYSGQFGVKGVFREIISGSTMAYRVGMYVGERPSQGWQYGAAFDFEDNSWSLKTNKKATLSSIGLLALARRNI